MRIFRKRKKFGNFHGTPEDAEPLPDIVYQMGAESAAQYVVAQSMPSNPYAATDPTGYQTTYGYPESEENFDEVRASSPFKFMATLLGIGRSKSRERHTAKSKERFIEAGSPVKFRDQPPGTPTKYRRRPASPEIVHSRPSSPFHFTQQERLASPLHFAPSERLSSPVHFAPPSHPNSPDVIRRLQRAQLSQDLQRIEREQRRQQELMLMNSVPFIPQYQQVPDPYYSMMNSNAYIPAYSSLPQQSQIYSYY
jgi:hypothetical protein